MKVLAASAEVAEVAVLTVSVAATAVTGTWPKGEGQGEDK